MSKSHANQDGSGAATPSMGLVCSMLRSIASKDGKARVALTSCVAGTYRLQGPLGLGPFCCIIRFPQPLP